MSKVSLQDVRPAHRIEADLLVVGGGAAGVAAAVTAARHGLDVVLVERYGFCGGGAVAGMSGTICGLYEASESDTAPPRQVVFGFADEFVQAMTARNGVTAPVRYGRTFTHVHDPLKWRETADDMLQASGVRVLLHTFVTDVLMDGGERVAGVMASTKQGRIEVRANLTIDASGDADVVAMAGLPFTVGHEGRVQNPTMIFRLQGVDVERFVATYGPDSILDNSVARAISEGNASGRYRLPRAKVFLFETPRPGELLCNATRIVGGDGRELNPIYVEDITEAEIEGRRQVREYERFFRDHLAGCQHAFVNDTGVQVGVRQTRQVVGISTLTNEDVAVGTKRADGIARSPWPIELHSGEKPRLSWLFEDTYEVPYGCFVPQRGESLLVAGRCLSAEHEAMASARVTAQCFAYGQAIGLAAVVAVREGVAPRAIGGEELRAMLNRDGARLDG
jgi:hypothetical protein